MNWIQALREAQLRLENQQNDRNQGSLAHEAHYLLEEAWRLKSSLPLPTKLQQSLHPELISIDEEIHRELEKLVERRTRGELLQHLIGHWGFYQNEYEVGPSVLIPRPETEILVDEVVKLLPVGIPFLGAEMGLGSGVISVELLFARPELKMVATDVSPPALAIAQRNASRILKLPEERLTERLRVKQAASEASPTVELLSLVQEGALDFLVSNPPYLDGSPASREVEADVRAQEPHVALFAPARDLLYFYRDIAQHVRQKLRPGGFVALEVPHERAESIQSLFGVEWFSTRLVEDLTGRPRVLVAKLLEKGKS